MRNSVSARKKVSGVEWIGEITSNWKVHSFRFCGVVPNGQVDLRLPQFREQTLVEPNHIESGTGRLIGTGTAAEQGAESGKITYVGKVIAGWFKRYCDHHGITPDVLNLLRAEHMGLGKAEKREAHKARLFRENVEELELELWRQAGRPEGGPVQFRLIAQQQLKQALNGEE